MSSTTVKVSTQTRDRIRSFGGDTLEDTIIDALDALETNQFWAQAEAAERWQRSLPPEEQERRANREADVDRLFDSID